MATSDGLHTGNPGMAQITAHLIEKDCVGVMTLSGALALTAQHRKYLKIDAGGAGRNIDLPAENISNGLIFHITNASDAAETLTVRDDAAGTVVAIAQNERATVVCDGTTWYHMGIETIALS